MFYYDPLLLLIGLVAGLISLGTEALVKLQFARGRRVPISSGLRGVDVARRILQDAGIDGVEIVEHQGFLSDHYNPLNRTLALSPDVYNGTDAAAAGVAAHEVGHAIQHARGYSPLWLRSAIVPVANLGSMLGPLIIMAGIWLGAAQGIGLGHNVAVAGVLLFGAATFFTLITVPVEFNASSRARERLVALGIAQPGPEADAVRGVLTAAGLTYVAAAIGSILHLLYWAYRAGLIGNNRRDD
jgi:Zn-dependent membrane protease YugP